MQGLSDFTDELISHLMEMLLRPSIPNQLFKMEKELVKRSLHIQKEDPVKKCFTEFNKLVFNEHPYSREIIGTEKSIKAITRKTLLEKHNESLASKEMVISYCGYEDLETVVEKIAPYIKQLPARKLKTQKSKNKVNPIINQRLSFEFDREQTHIMIGKPSYLAGSLEDLYIKVFTTFLSGQSSELFLEVRDKQGLCYSVQAVQNSALEASYWGIYIGSGTDKKDKAIKAVQDILSKYQNKGLKKSEFNTTLKMIQGQNSISIQTNDDYANFYSIAILHNLGIDYQHESYEKIKNMKFEDFNKFLNNFLKEDWNIVEVGRKTPN